jgi:Bestrophin, RFP-TM, chloride channel
MILSDVVSPMEFFLRFSLFIANKRRVVGIVTTPIPFPLVQMSRTFLFFYIYTLPSALLTASSTPEADLVVLFIVTYGFIGLELISIELDDPFGDDVIDFDTLRSLHVRLIANLAVIFYSLKTSTEIMVLTILACLHYPTHAKTVFDDICSTIGSVDGMKAAVALRSKLDNSDRITTANASVINDETTRLLSRA